jgi:transposase InsO family protein
MTGNGTAMDVKLAAGVAGAVRAGEVAQFCRDQGISRQTFYKWKARYQADGFDGLEDRSRCPLTSPTRTPVEIEELVVRIRKELDDFGSDNGPWSIRQQLLACVASSDQLPSEATIWRMLRRRGLSAVEPRKRPRSSWKRFVWARPNDLWQVDATHWALADGTVVEIINIIDDHSRLCPASKAVLVCTCAAAWEAFEQASETWGLPARMLSDNNLSFNGSHRNVTVEFETNLRLVGVQPIASTPFHPQTCGKIERFHETMKKWLRKRPLAKTLEELQAQLDEWVEHYNHHRPHRSLNGARPAEVWARTAPAKPAAHPITVTTTTRREIRVGNSGSVRAGAYTVGLGRPYAKQLVTVITTGNDCAVFLDGHCIRQLTIDPTVQHQRIPGATHHPYQYHLPQ